MNVGVFLIVWGVLFCGISCSAFFANSEAPGFIWIFVLIGVLVFSIGVSICCKNAILKKLSKTGKIAKGFFVSSASNVTVNDVPMFYIKFVYTNDYGTKVEYKTQSKYTFDEIRYYESLGEFEIRYNEKYAVITEVIDAEKMIELRQNGFRGFDDRLSENLYNNQEKSYICSYCDNVQNTAGKCKHCGAVIKSEDRIRR